MRGVVTADGPLGTTFVPPDSDSLLFSGRTLRDVTSGAVTFDWPGVSLLFSTSSSSCRIFLNETQTNRYAVLLSDPDNLTEYQPYANL
eukprot:6335533-Prymnesium_polylepis.1